MNQDRTRQWYYVVGIEIETIIAADYPASAETCLHDVIHKMLDHLDRHKCPRVVCNLVQNVDGWEGFDPKLSAVAYLNQNVKNVRPVKETTFIAPRARGRKLT